MESLFISIIIPLLNEEANLRELHRRLVDVLEGLSCRRRIIFVDDGSTDGSAGVIDELARQDPDVIGICLSRNFGHEVASSAGLDHAVGDVTELMDADLQDPPEVIGQMIERWRQGNEIVYAVRRRRHGESWFKKSTSWLFYRLLDKLSDVQVPMDTGDFRLMDARVVEAVRQCREQDRFLRGLIAWSGFRSTSIVYDRPARSAGATHYSPLKLLLLSLDAVVGFSITPLRFATAVGMIVTVICLCVALVVLVQKAMYKIEIPGYALLATGLFFLGGVQMLLLGILGEYLGRVYRQCQGRPLYLIARTIGADPDARGTVRRNVRDGAEALVVPGQAQDRPASAEALSAAEE